MAQPPFYRRLEAAILATAQAWHFQTTVDAKGNAFIQLEKMEINAAEFAKEVARRVQ